MKSIVFAISLMITTSYYRCEMSKKYRNPLINLIFDNISLVLLYLIYRTIGLDILPMREGTSILYLILPLYIIKLGLTVLSIIINIIKTTGFILNKFNIIKSGCSNEQ